MSVCVIPWTGLKLNGEMVMFDVGVEIEVEVDVKVEVYGDGGESALMTAPTGIHSYWNIGGLMDGWAGSEMIGTRRRTLFELVAEASTDGCRPGSGS